MTGVMSTDMKKFNEVLREKYPQKTTKGNIESHDWNITHTTKFFQAYICCEEANGESVIEAGIRTTLSSGTRVRKKVYEKKTFAHSEEGFLDACNWIDNQRLSMAEEIAKNICDGEESTHSRRSLEIDRAYWSLNFEPQKNRICATIPLTGKTKNFPLTRCGVADACDYLLSIIIPNIAEYAAKMTAPIIERAIREGAKVSGLPEDALQDFDWDKYRTREWANRTREWARNAIYNIYELRWMRDESRSRHVNIVGAVMDYLGDFEEPSVFNEIIRREGYRGKMPMQYGKFFHTEYPDKEDLAEMLGGEESYKNFCVIGPFYKGRKSAAEDTNTPDAD